MGGALSPVTGKQRHGEKDDSNGDDKDLDDDAGGGGGGVTLIEEEEEVGVTSWKDEDGIIR